MEAFISWYEPASYLIRYSQRLVFLWMWFSSGGNAALLHASTDHLMPMFAPHTKASEYAKSPITAMQCCCSASIFLIRIHCMKLTNDRQRSRRKNLTLCLFQRFPFPTIPSKLCVSEFKQSINSKVQSLRFQKLVN